MKKRSQVLKQTNPNNPALHVRQLNPFTSKVEKQLKELIEDKFIIWISKLYVVARHFYTDALKAKSLTTDPEVKTAIGVTLSALVNHTMQLMQLIDDQKESISILRRSPPGYGAAILDFMKNILYDPKAPTQKQQYQEQIRKLDKSINKDYLDIGSMFGIPKQSIDMAVDTGLKQVLGENITDEIRKSTSDTISDIKLDRLLNKNTLNLFENLNEAYKKDPEQIYSTAINIISQIIKILKAGITPEQELYLDQRFKAFEQALLSIKKQKEEKEGNSDSLQNVASFQQVFKYAKNFKYSEIDVNSLKSFRNLLDTYEFKLKPYFDILQNNYFINRVNQILGSLGQGWSGTYSKEQQVDFASRYSTYFETLFDNSGRNNFATYLKQIQSELEILQNSIDKIIPTESNIEQIQPNIEQKNPVMQKQTPEDVNQSQEEVMRELRTKLKILRKHITGQISKL